MCYLYVDNIKKSKRSWDQAEPERLLTKTAAPSFDPKPLGDCNDYKLKTENCDHDWQGKKCGTCFNPGARAGVRCHGFKNATGYMCPPDHKHKGDGGDLAYACMDWTFGSTATQAAEASYNGRSGKHPVYFGVGTYGVAFDKDSMGGLGMCVLMHVEGVDRYILAQSLNTGHDVAGNQFDLQIGAGGVGIFNTCAGGKSSMFPGGKKPWGHQYGGLDKESQCADLPEYPRKSKPMKAAGDSLVKLCEHAFKKGVYQNPSIQSITRVACPAELVNLTQFRRSDEPSETESESQTAERRLTAAHKCRLGAPGATADWCMTRMMDCRKPSGAIKDNIHLDKVAKGHRLVQPCTVDGYTRIDVQCGCHDCYC